MLINNKSIIDLKILSETEASHGLQNSEVCSSRARGAGTAGVQAAPATVRDSEAKGLHEASFWAPPEVPLPSPQCPCILAPQIPSPKQVLGLSSGESVLESFNCLGHHWCNFLHSRFPRIIGDSATDHWHQVGTAGAGAVIGWFLRAGVKAVAAGRNVAASCGIRGWLNLDFLRDSCSSCSKLLLPASDISRWLGHGVDKGHLCSPAFGLIGMCKLDVLC